MAEFKKYERDGKVAVLVSPGYGAGWSTWNSEIGEQLSMDRDLVAAALKEGRESVLGVVERKYPSAYKGGLEDLEVEWVPKGVRFEITEYDGYESLRIFSDEDGWVA